MSLRKNDVVEMQEPVGGGWNSPTADKYEGEGIKTGTVDDAKDMHRLGRAQEFKRNFRSFSVLGLSSVIMATWVAFLGSSSFSLVNGGLAGTVWVYIAIWIFTIPVTLSLAEMASMAPTSGGQYHWLVYSSNTLMQSVRPWSISDPPYFTESQFARWAGHLADYIVNVF